MNSETIRPVKKSIVVNASQAKAFKVFTEGIDSWWPRAHKIGAAPLKRAVLESKAGGRWYEIGEDGSECNWGKVLAFEPPGRLLLAWQITATWQYDEALMTEVEVRFVPEGDKRTRVELEHRNLERFGTQAAELFKVFDSPQGWGGILEGFANAVLAAPA